MKITRVKLRDFSVRRRSSYETSPKELVQLALQERRGGRRKGVVAALNNNIKQWIANKETIHMPFLRLEMRQRATPHMEILTSIAAMDTED